MMNRSTLKQAWGTLFFTALSGVALASHPEGCQSCGESHLGACATCANIWDDYCANKPKCFKPSKVINKIANLNLRPQLGCNCVPAGGVGLYGQPWGGCPTCSSPVGHSLLGLFKKKHHSLHDSCDEGCDAGFEVTESWDGNPAVSSFAEGAVTAPGCAACGGHGHASSGGAPQVAPAVAPANRSRQETLPVLAPAPAPLAPSARELTRPSQLGAPGAATLSTGTLTKPDPIPANTIPAAPFAAGTEARDPVPAAPALQGAEIPAAPAVPPVPQGESLPLDPAADASDKAPSANTGAFQWLKKSILID